MFLRIAVPQGPVSTTHSKTRGPTTNPREARTTRAQGGARKTHTTKDDRSQRLADAGGDVDDDDKIHAYDDNDDFGHDNSMDDGVDDPAIFPD
eukprot:5644763-Pyramimonas_sp.AAC.1